MIYTYQATTYHQMWFDEGIGEQYTVRIYDYCRYGIIATITAIDSV